MGVVSIIFVVVVWEKKMLIWIFYYMNVEFENKVDRRIFEFCKVNEEF